MTTRSRMTRTASALLVAAATLALPACQSDGTIGREDSYSNTVWREKVRRETFRRDLQNTKDNLAGIPGLFTRSFSDFPERLRLLQHLYVDGVGKRWGYRETHMIPEGNIDVGITKGSQPADRSE